MRKTDPCFADPKAAWDRRDPAAHAELVGLALELPRRFVELLADPQQAGSIRRRHTQRAREVVETRRMHAFDQGRDVDPGPAARLFDPVAARPATLKRNRKPIAGQGAAIRNQIEAADLSEAATPFWFGAHRRSFLEWPPERASGALALFLRQLHPQPSIFMTLQCRVVSRAVSSSKNKWFL